MSALPRGIRTSSGNYLNGALIVEALYAMKAQCEEALNSAPNQHAHMNCMANLEYVKRQLRDCGENTL